MTRPLAVWVDLANAPHVQLFQPIVLALRAIGHEVVVTGRDFNMTLEMAQRMGMDVLAIGEGHEADNHEDARRRCYLRRVEALVAFAEARRFDVAVSHGSYTQIRAAELLDIPTVAALDYEHTFSRRWPSLHRFLTPDRVPAATWIERGVPAHAIVSYPGLKEHLYVNGHAGSGHDANARAINDHRVHRRDRKDFALAPDPRDELGIAADVPLVAFRPVSDTAHYLNGLGKGSEPALLERLRKARDVTTVLLPRTRAQARRFAASTISWHNFVIPTAPIDGPALVRSADLVVSGGGTMIREAAVLGVPAGSFFPGPWGAVDQSLLAEGQIADLRNPEALDRMLPRGRVIARPPPGPTHPVDLFVNEICRAAAGGQAEAVREPAPDACP